VHPLVRALAFTGSLKGGRALFNLAAARNEPIPVFAEMGSSNPLFLLPEALRERGGEIAAGFAEALTLGVGQFCTNPGLLFAIAGSDLEAFVTRISSILGEKPAGVMLHRGIRETYVSNVSRRSRIAGVRSIGEVGESGQGGCAAAPVLLRVDLENFFKSDELADELFGPAAVLVECADREELLTAARRLHGQLTATLHGTTGDFAAYAPLVGILEGKAGRLICNGFPTGVEVGPAMVHGGPYPATTDSRFTSVGTAAIQRFLRPVCYQNFPPEFLPEGLRSPT
jgi:NADP-dependent aldehyde dehydrogenase